MRVLFDELDSFSETYLGEEVSGVLEGFGFVVGDHFVDVFYVLWVLEDLVEHDGFDLQVGEVAQVSRSEDRLLLDIVVQDEQSVLLHQSAQFWVIGRPNDGPHLLSLVGQVLSAALFASAGARVGLLVGLHVVE